MNIAKSLSLAVAGVLLSSCHERSTEAGTHEVPAEAAPHAVTAETPESKASNPEQWIGRWNGPEGTYLSISKNGRGYALELADLDGPRKYEARNAGGHLEFERSGTTESIRATGGKETGMKWLSDKTDCLTIKAGEGYCRD